jgi:uncharacterized protein
MSRCRQQQGQPRSARRSRRLGTVTAAAGLLTQDAAKRTLPAQLLDLFEPVDGSLSVLAGYIGPHKIMWATDYAHSDGFFPGAPQMIGERIGPLSPEAKHQALAGRAMGF